jgi:predicted alpha/beta hydrolase
MRLTQSVPSEKVLERPVRFTTADRVSLVGTWFELLESKSAPSTVVVVACGAGIAARFYRGLARYLAAQGAAVLTFDYRGIGASRQGSIRNLKGGMEYWGAFDLGAALEEAGARHPSLALAAVAHSVGTLLIGAALDAAKLSRLVFLGPHTGYWRDYERRRRKLLYLVWHVMMPALTKRVGYFPGHLLRLGEDLPPQVALDWAARLQPELVVNPKDALRFAGILERYRDVRADTLAISISDDAFAPPDAASRLLSMYPNISVVREVVTPASIECRRLGHFGFLRRSTGEYFWARVATWLIPNSLGPDCDLNTLTTVSSVSGSPDSAPTH